MRKNQQKVIKQAECGEDEGIWIFAERRKMLRTDVHDKKARSFNMSRIRDKDTKPELLVIKFLFGKGFRYKLHDKSLPGKPDLVLPKHRTVIFIGYVLRMWV